MYQTLPKMLKDVSEKNPDTSAQYYKNAKSEFLQISFNLLKASFSTYTYSMLQVWCLPQSHFNPLSKLFMSI